MKQEETNFRYFGNLKNAVKRKITQTDDSENGEKEEKNEGIKCVNISTSTLTAIVSEVSAVLDGSSDSFLG